MGCPPVLLSATSLMLRKPQAFATRAKERLLASALKVKLLHTFMK